MNDFELLKTTLERRQAEAQGIAARADELVGLIAAYQVVLADLQGLRLDEYEAPEPVEEPKPVPEPVQEPAAPPLHTPANEVDAIVAQIDLSIPYREMTTDQRDKWFTTHELQIARLFEITTAVRISLELGIPSGSTTAAKRRIVAMIDVPVRERSNQTEVSPLPEPLHTPAENGTSPQESGVPTPKSGVACAHQWDIETPNGPTSEGVCSMCGETKDFANSQPDSTWDRTPKGKE